MGRGLSVHLVTCLSIYLSLSLSLSLAVYRYTGDEPLTIHLS